MSEIRYEPLTGTWVVIATERKKRPSDFVIAHEEKTGAFCPFCPGNEDHTPPEVYAVRPEGKPNTPGWLTRVVPNKFPALSPDNQDKKQAPTGGDLLAKSPGLGAHEVILESPDHETTFPFLTPEQQALVVATWHQRYTELQQNPDFKFAQLFKNHGAEAGASLEHPHSQLIATPVVPRAVETEIRRSADYHLRQGNCLICSLIEKELQEGARILTQNRSFVVFCPFASRFVMEMWVVPLKHEPCFGDLSPAEFPYLAEALKQALGRLAHVMEDPPYNMLLRTAPYPKMDEKKSYHWHFQILPRLTHMAGFELGTGMFINPTPPEQAAEFLREVHA